MTGTVNISAGTVPRVSANLTAADRMGTIKARWGVGRMHYAVEPGLYAVGAPDERSPVMVTANYKMSFDRLRQSLAGIDAWILVLDTSGINVWCAAGKGSFGTGELARRMETSRLKDIVGHRQLILPQLGAPGVAAHAVKKETGFSVIYGPVRAEDLPAFLEAGQKATPQMRRKGFPMSERIALAPMELVPAMKWALVLVPILFLLAGVGHDDGFWAGATQRGLTAVAIMVSGLIAGTVFTPMLLPWLPGRAFSVKGAFAGAIASALLLWVWPTVTGFYTAPFEAFGLLLLATALAAFLGMNFTGSTTYTSLSGVKKEMKWAVPAEIVMAALGAGIWIGSLVA